MKLLLTLPTPQLEWGHFANSIYIKKEVIFSYKFDFQVSLLKYFFQIIHLKIPSKQNFLLAHLLRIPLLSAVEDTKTIATVNKARNKGDVMKKLVLTLVILGSSNAFASGLFKNLIKLEPGLIQTVVRTQIAGMPDSVHEFTKCFTEADLKEKQDPGDCSVKILKDTPNEGTYEAICKIDGQFLTHVVTYRPESSRKQVVTTDMKELNTRSILSYLVLGPCK